MAPTASWAATQTELPIRMSLHPTFWDQLNAEQRMSCRRTEDPVTIDGRPGYDICGILEEKWKHMFPAIQAHLNSRAAKIFKTHQGRQIEYAFWPYMIGTPTDFRPYVVASCLYLDIAKRVLKVIHEKLRSFTPRPGFGYLPINCRITLPMEPTQPEQIGAWGSDQSGKRYRYVGKGGSRHIQYSNETAFVRPYLATSASDYPRMGSVDPPRRPPPSVDGVIPRDTSPPSSQSTTSRSHSHSSLPREENVLVPPFTLFPRELEGRSEYTESAIRRSSMIPVEPVLAPAPRNMCGMAINIKCRKGKYETVGTTTIGGCLCIDSKYYGFTVAHVLAAGFQNHPKPMSGSAGPTSESWESDAELSDLSESDDELDASTAKLESLSLKPRLNEFSWRPQSDLGPWQKVSKASSILGDDLDWLLFPLGNEVDRFENVVELYQNRIIREVVYPKEVEGGLPADIESITLVTGVSGKKQVRPSTTLCGIFIPSAGHVVQVWSIRSGSYVARPGDSGSWAIGQGGEVYGYLVGICEQMGAGYIAPMSTAMAAIRAKTNTSGVTIPSRMAGTRRQDHADYPEARSDSTSRRHGSRDHAGSYLDRTRHGEDVMIEPSVTKRTGFTAPPQWVARSSTNAPISTTTGTARRPPSNFSRFGQEFAKIPEGDYQTCQEFMARNPEIFDENPNDFLLEAVRSQVEGQVSQARRHVQQALLLQKLSKKSREETRVFFSRLNGRDARERDAFRADLKKVYDGMKANAAAAQSNATPGPASKGPDSKGAHRVPTDVRRAPEPTLQNSSDGVSESLEKLNVGTHYPRNSTRADGPPSNAARPPTVKYPSGGGRRRQTLTSVDEDPRSTLSDDSQSQGGAPSIAEPDIRGNGEAYEQLDERYYVRLDGGTFFKVGRVFAMLWHENAGEPPGGHLSSTEKISLYRAGKSGEILYSHILRMAVVKARHGYCWCIPIHTYDGRGVLKPGFNRQDQEAHAIIYMDDTKPESTSRQEKDAMIKRPIAVHPASADQKLHVMSRLHFGSPYTVQMNVKVMNVGMVIPTSMPAFESYWHNEMNS